MANDGAQLERLVAFVEAALLPRGFDVKTNTHIYNDEGVQIAEFDVEVKGKIGTTELAWLIECRDRPGQGAAPGSWIEQLVGRRTRFGFNKVTAVSTTEFSSGATEFARDQGIELRVVRALEPESFKDWLIVQEFFVQHEQALLESGRLLLGQDESTDREAVARALSASKDGRFLRSVKTGNYDSIPEAFLMAIETQQLFQGIELNKPAVRVKFTATYPQDDDHYLIDTDAGPVRVAALLFVGSLMVTERLIPMPLNALVEYRKNEAAGPISQFAAFEPIEILGHKLALEVHKLADTGEMHVTFRKNS